MKDVFLFFLIFLILVVSFVVFKGFYTPLKEQVLLSYSLRKNEKILDRLTLEQKIGQLFVIGFEGKVLNSEIENLIKEIHPGGVLLLGRNIEDENQLKELINSLQEIALQDTGLPLFIAIDQEGGMISRVGWVEKTPQSEIENREQAYQIGLIRGKELTELGINLNLAPLLDLASSGDFIFERAFQKNPEITGKLGKALIQGQKEGGIFTTIKHFPGYGRISFNPEERLAILEKTPEISQFQKAVEAHPELIMVSNMVYRDIDGELPFSFLKKGISFLKTKIPEDILIISDDLAQNSLLNNFSLKEIVTLPIEAGVDILIFSGWRIPVKEGVSAFEEAVESGKISGERINQSVLKIIELKNEI